MGHGAIGHGTRKYTLCEALGDHDDPLDDLADY
jgi:hypothetical protein